MWDHEGEGSVTAPTGCKYHALERVFAQEIATDHQDTRFHLKLVTTVEEIQWPALGVLMEE
jgi:hypothetical protein